MKTIEYYDIEVWDGGDRHNRKFSVASEHEAKKWKEAKENRYDTYTKHTLVVFDTLEEAMENDLASVRKRLLAKLTPLEKQALGIRE